MPRATVYLGEPSGQALVKGTWMYARGYVPGMWPHGKTPPRGLEHFLPDLLRDFSTAPSR